MFHAIFGIYLYTISLCPCNTLDNEDMNQRNFDKRAKSSFESRKTTSGCLKKAKIVLNSCDKISVRCFIPYPTGQNFHVL